MLNDFSVDALSKRIKFETIPDGIQVSLQLPSPDGGPDFSVSRVYVNQSDGEATIFDKHKIVEIPNLPVLEIWPNFRTPDWKVYYTYFSDPVLDTFYAEPYGNHDDQQKILASQTSDVDVEKAITKTSHFPEIMVCKYKDEEAGVLLISVSDTLSDDGKTWNIGIDFGDQRHYRL